MKLDKFPENFPLNNALKFNLRLEENLKFLNFTHSVEARLKGAR